MIFYKIAKILPYYKDRYLSTKVKQEKSKIIFKKISLKDVWENYWLIFLIPILLIILTYIFKIFDLSGFNNVVEVLKTLITVPLILVGTVLPIVTLIITIVGNKVSSKFVKLYLDILKPLQIFRIAIFALVINIFLYFVSVSTLHIIKYPFSGIVPFTALLGGLTLTFILIPLLGTSWLIQKTIKSILDDNFLYESIKKYMKNRMINNIDAGIEHNLFEKLFNEMCGNFGITFLPFFSGKEKHYKPLKASKTGLVIDINLKKLNEFNNLLKKFETENKKVLITKGPANLISKEDDLLCYLNRGLDNENYVLLESKLNEVFITNKNYKSEDIKQDLDNLRTVVKNTINENEEDKFRKIIDVYINCLEYYMQSIKKINSNMIPDNSPFEPFRVLTLIRFHFNDISEWIVQSNHKHLIEIFSNKLNKILTKTIDYQNYDIFEMLNEIFSTIYYFSVKNENNDQKIRPISYYEICEHDIKEHLEDPELSSEDFIVLKKFLYKIIDYLTGFAMNAISYDDFETFNVIDQYFPEILQMYEAPIGDLWNIERKITKKMNGLEESNNQYKQLKEELNILESRINIDKDVKKKILINWIKIGNKLLKKINNLSSDEWYNKALKTVFEKFSDNKKLLEMFDFMFDEERGPSLDSYSLFFCLGQLKTWKYSDLPSSKMIKFNMDQIKKGCEKIIKEKDQWKWLIDVDIEETIKILIGSCQKSLDKFDEEEENEIIKLPLSPTKVNDFKKNIKKSISDSSGILSFFIKYGQIIPKKSHISGSYNNRSDLIEKAPFVDKKGPIDYMSPWINYNKIFVKNKERFIIEKILEKTDGKKVRSNKENLTSFIEKYITEIADEDYSTMLILLPIGFSTKLLNEEFSIKRVYENDKINLKMFYKNKITILKHQKIPDNNILIVDPKKSKLIQIEDLKIDIRTLNEDEKVKRNETDRELDLTVKVEMEEKFDFIIMDNAILKIEYNN